MKKIFTVLVIIFLAASFVYAADDDFSIADKDKSSKLSRQEYLDAVGAKFDKYDKNKDGLLTKDELRQIYQIDVEKFVQAVDTDNDGKISKNELQQAAEARFSKFDKNDDGQLSKKEWKSGRNMNDPMLVLFRF